MSKTTSLAQLQNDGEMDDQYDGQNSMADVEDVMNQLGNSNNDQEAYFEQQQQEQQEQQHLKQQQQQQAQMMAAQEQQAKMMAAQEHQAKMMAAQEQQRLSQKQHLPSLLTASKPPQSIIEKVISELKDSVLVLVVFVILNLKPVGQLTFDIVSKLTTNEYLLLLIRGGLAGVLFYIVKRLILNQ